MKIFVLIFFSPNVIKSCKKVICAKKSRAKKIFFFDIVGSKTRFLGNVPSIVE